MAERPERIITTGSSVAIPVCIAGWVLNIPIELFELNTHPGKTMRFLATFAQTIRHCFVTTRDFFPRHHCTLTDYPVRFAIHSSNNQLTAFEKKRTTVFIHGGSQGSQQLNLLMQKLLTEHPSLAKKIQIIHQTGAHPTEVKKQYDMLHIPAHVFRYEDTLEDYYCRADLVICRAGAGALFETLFFQKKCITLPLMATAHNHQLKNAQAMAHEYPHLFQVARTQQQAIEYMKRALK